MPALLSDEWFELQRATTADLPLRPGASASIQFDVAGGPHGPVTFHQVIEDGRVVAAGNGPVDDADFTLIRPHRRLHAGAGEGHREHRTHALRHNGHGVGRVSRGDGSARRGHRRRLTRGSGAVTVL